MRIVADTNTVVSGLLWQGEPRTLIDSGRAGRLSLVTSVTLIDELARVLDRREEAQECAVDQEPRRDRRRQKDPAQVKDRKFKRWQQVLLRRG